MRKILALLLFVLPSIALAAQKADFVLVNKSEAKLFLISNGEAFREFDVVFGANPKGHKEKGGDERTPEAKYVLDYKK
ncbi:hypothetical protein [Pseudomonas sp. gcc21]|uniref:hypothetical protein n=1 Tax=Pseudomonas sp. gcc21 TaxID=2726989 RepID=UPI001C49C601|nr:hypothetical protein [Pseudomonas sp. gcc21]